MKLNNLDSQNFIIKSVGEKTFKQLEPELEKVEMPLTQLLNDSWSQISHVYFPETSVISVVNLLENGNGVESGIIGKEGVLGATSIFAGEISLGEATVQLGGEGWRMKVSAFKNLFENNIEFRKIILAYVFNFVAQITQNALCLCYHNIEKRLARWLLMFQDRAEREKLVLTQEFLAEMLGVHRPSVSKNANKLQSMNLISYTRGVVTILDREGLENFSCECYKTITEINEMVRAK
ncbi:MAG: Crp/Fnr family transcriptional regulator [Acidobacteriota bacterium]